MGLMEFYLLGSNSVILPSCGGLPNQVISGTFSNNDNTTLIRTISIQPEVTGEGN